MPDITRRRQGEMVRKVFEILLAHPEGLAAKDVLTATADGLTLTPFEVADYPNRPGVQRSRTGAEPVRVPGPRGGAN